MVAAVHKGKYGNRILSPIIWGVRTFVDAAQQFQLEDGVFMYDDFENVPDLSNDAERDKYQSYIDTGNTVKGTALISESSVAKRAIGTLSLDTDATDNDECGIGTGGGIGVAVVISDTSGYSSRVCFECRIAFAQVADTKSGVFIGLTEEGLANADGILNDDGTLQSKDFIGFWRDETDGDQIDVVYRKNGQALQTTKADALGSALVADTFVKMGFVYDPTYPTAQRIKFFFDEVELGSYVTGTNIAAATFPDAEELVFTFMMKNAGAAAASVDLDWWAVGMSGVLV